MLIEDFAKAIAHFKPDRMESNDAGWCSRAVALLSNWQAKFIAIDEQSND